MLKFLLSRKRIKGSVVDLLPTYKVTANEENQFAASYFFDICISGTNTVVGRCDLRVGHNEELYYLGNIGYSVWKEYQGNYYAYYACLLLFEIAYGQYQMDSLIITCNPENIASYKTCLKLNGEYLGVKPVPSDHYCYRIGEKEKCLFEYQLPQY